MADPAHPHVVLVGLSGTGKTSIGRLVAQHLGMPLFDSDEAVEAKAGQTVREVFEAQGETRFRKLEADAIAEALDADGPTVVSAGGGAVVTRRTRDRLSEPDVFCVWLTAEPAFLASRAAGKRHRPLLDGDPVAVLTRLSNERRPWFEQVADATVDVQTHLAEEPKPRAKARLADLVTDMVLLRRARRTRDHFVMVGPMGAGKSTVGVALARRLERPYVDSDTEVERRTGRTARQIGASDGLPALHQLELSVLRDALTSNEPAVIASAASVVDECLGRLALATARTVVWLRVDPRELQERVADDDAGDQGHRPTIDPTVDVAREPLYRSVATMAIDVGDLPPEVVAEMVPA